MAGERSTAIVQLVGGDRIPGHPAVMRIRLKHHGGVDAAFFDLANGQACILRFTRDGRLYSFEAATRRTDDLKTGSRPSAGQGN